MRKLILRGVAACALALSTAAFSVPASATTYVEDFEDPFATWETEWFGQLSNAANYYVIHGSPTSYRGNNPDGLWIHDGNSNTPEARILFDPTFGASLTSLFLDIGSHTATTLTIFDINGVTLFTSAVAAGNSLTEPGAYTNYGVTSASGIGGFALSGNAEGNVGIDNIVVQSGLQSAVPEPGTWAMMLLGFGAVGFAMRRSARRRGHLLQIA